MRNKSNPNSSHKAENIEYDSSELLVESIGLILPIVAGILIGYTIPKFENFSLTPKQKIELRESQIKNISAEIEKIRKENIDIQ